MSLVSLSLLLPGSGAVLAGVDGEALYRTACTGCHSTSVHARDNRGIGSLSALREQVADCAKSTDAD